MALSQVWFWPDCVATTICNLGSHAHDHGAARWELGKMLKENLTKLPSNLCLLFLTQSGVYFE